MTDLTKIRITASAELALKKLKKAEIAVFDCKKSGAELLFCVKDKDVKKVFAIFDKPCYNIKVDKKATRRGFLTLFACARDWLRERCCLSRRRLSQTRSCLK